MGPQGSQPSRVLEKFGAVPTAPTITGDNYGANKVRAIPATPAAGNNCLHLGTQNIEKRTDND